MAKKTMLDCYIPDEIWMRILEVGINNRILNPKDVCSFSICSKHFNRLANDNDIWSAFLTLSFPDYLNHRNSFSQKSLYQQTYEIFKKKAFELLAEATERKLISQRQVILRRKIQEQRQEMLQLSREVNKQKQQILKGRKEKKQLIQQQICAREEQLMLLRGDFDDSEREMTELDRAMTTLKGSRRSIRNSDFGAFFDLDDLDNLYDNDLGVEVPADDLTCFGLLMDL